MTLVCRGLHSIPHGFLLLAIAGPHCVLACLTWLAPLWPCHVWLNHQHGSLCMLPFSGSVCVCPAVLSASMQIEVQEIGGQNCIVLQQDASLGR